MKSSFKLVNETIAKLDIRSQNYHVWSEKVKMILSAEFDIHAECIATREPTNFSVERSALMVEIELAKQARMGVDAHNLEFPDDRRVLDPAHVLSLAAETTLAYREEEETYLATRKVMTEQAAKHPLKCRQMIAFIQLQLTPDSLRLLEVSEGYIEAVTKHDLLKVWAIIEREHMVASSDSSLDIAAMKADFYKFEQGSNKSYEEYERDFVIKMNELHYRKVAPSAEETAYTFMKGLRAHKHREYVLSLVQRKEMPKTLPEAMRLIRNFDSTTQNLRAHWANNSGKTARSNEDIVAATTRDGVKGNKEHRRSQKDSSDKKSDKFCSYCAKHATNARYCHSHNTDECRTKRREQEEGKSNADATADEKKQKKPNKKRDAKKPSTSNSNAAVMGDDDGDDSDYSWSWATVLQNAERHQPSAEPAAVLAAHLQLDATDISQEGVLALDTGAEVHVIKDVKLLKRMKELKRPRHLRGVGGGTTVHRTGKMKHFGEALFVPGAVTNLISLSRALANKFTLTTATAHGRQQLILNRDDTRIAFTQNRRGLFLCLPTNSKKPDPVAFLEIDTTQLPPLQQLDTTRHFTPEHVKRAKEAIALHRLLNHPSDKVLLHSLDNNMISGCHLTGADLRNARTLFGHFCDACTRAKMTRPAAPTSTAPPAPAIADTLHTDIVFIADSGNRKIGHLISVEPNTGYTHLFKLPTKAEPDLLHAVKKVVDDYKKHGHTVRTIRSDREAVFTALTTDLSTMGVSIQQTPPEQHERRAERKVRELKDKLRATLLSLPYRLPRSLYPFLAQFVVSSINMLPNVNTGNSNPSSLVTGTKADMQTSLRAPFGALVLCHVPNRGSNDMAPRAEYGIVVGRENHSGNIKVYRLHERDIVNRYKFTPVQHTSLIINTINKISLDDMIIETDEDDLFHNEETASPAPNTNSADSPASTSTTTTTTTTTTSTIDPGLARPPTAAPINDSATPAPVTYRGAEADPPAPLHHRGVDATADATAPEPAEQAHFEPTYTDEDAQPEHDAPPEEPRYGLRTRGVPSWMYVRHALSISIRQAMTKNEQAAIAALKKELQQMIVLDVWEAISRNDVPLEERNKIVPSHVIFKEKYLPSGEFEKLKARLVADGNREDISHIERKLSSSPTVATSSVMIGFAISAFQRWKRCAIDFTSAYLNAHLKDLKKYMRLPAPVVKVLIEMHPEMQKFQTADGSMIVKLRKAIYGLVEAARLWYDHVSDTLITLGYTKTPSDNCVFVRRVNKEECIIFLHVDDMFITYSDTSLYDDLLKGLQRHYKGLTVKADRTLSYLGMEATFDDDNGSVTLGQTGYVSDIIKRFNITGKASSPADNDLFKSVPDSPPTDITRYRSMVMSTFYLAKRTRPDLLVATSYLASRCAAPTEDDQRKLNRVLMYVNATKHLSLTLRPDSLDIHAYIDASFGCHPDGKSHSGIVITLGRSGGPVHAQSSKQKLVTKHSTEAELVGINDGVSQVMWTRALLRDLHLLTPGPSKIMQDNRSTIIIANNGTGHKGRTRHIDVRYFYVSERIQAGDVILQWLPTEEMPADALTKPLAGALFHKLRAMLLNETTALSAPASDRQGCVVPSGNK
jgi:hypothetical protein